MLLSAAVEGVFPVAGRSILELGAGAHGFVGRAISQLCPTAEVTLTEGHPGAVDLLREAAAGERCRIEELGLRI